MKYAAYEIYAPSESVWLDQLPAHWKQLRVKHVIERMESGVSVNSDACPVAAEEIGVLKTSCVYGDQFAPSENKRVLDDELGRVACHVKADRLIISRMNTPELVGSCGYVERDFPNLFLPDRLWQTVFSKSRECLPRFAWYYLTSRPAKSAISSLAAGTSGSMQNIAQDAFVSIGFPLPPLEEQQAIARFLDAKTAQIDTLVAKKRQLIDKLKEKRSALIARTVTRGLPPEAAKAAGLEPNPEMKDSGVEWLGAIPAHWTAVQLRRHVRFITSGSRGWAEHYADTGSIFVRIGNLTRDSLNVDLSDIQYVAPPPGTEGERTKIKVGDLLFSITAYLGSIAVAPESLQDAFVSQHVALVRLMPNSFMPRYAGYCVLADAGQAQLNEQGYGGTKIQLSLDDVKALWLPQPPADEQQAISAYLDRETAQLDTLIAKIERAISRLTEYRQALITSAVTGKIDVRTAANLETEVA